MLFPHLSFLSAGQRSVCRLINEYVDNERCKIVQKANFSVMTKLFSRYNFMVIYLVQSDGLVDCISGVARICCQEGQSWKLGHETLTADFRAGCSSSC